MVQFKNKKVAVVGNARSLFKENFGEQIDKHDIVARFNRGLPTKKQQGTKFTVLVITNFNLIKDLSIPSSVITINTNDIDKSYLLNLKEKLNLTKKSQKPSTGLLFLEYLLDKKPSKISLFGFDWKKTETYYHEEYYKQKETSWPNHNFKNEELYIKNNLVSKFNIEIY